MRVYIYVYIYMYVFSNLLSTGIQGYQEQRKKNPPGTRDKNISNHRPGKKEKISQDKKKKKKKKPTS